MKTVFRLLLVALLAIAPSTHGEPATEASLRAALIYNFALFVEWPAERERKDAANFYLCVTPEDALDASITALESRRVRSKATALRRVRVPIAPDVCDLLYISQAEKAHLPEIVASLQSRPVLTISDATSAARTGVVIGLDVENQRMVFDVNAQAARKQGLNINSKLLRLSRTVIEQ